METAHDRRFEPSKRLPLPGSLPLRQADYLEVLNHFAARVADHGRPDDIAWGMAKDAVARLGFVDCVVYLLSEDGESLVQAAAHGPKNPEGREIACPIVIAMGEGIVGAAAWSKEVQLVADTRVDPRYIEDDERRLSELAVPIVHQGRLYGVLDSEHPEAGFYSEEDVKVLSTIASVAATQLARTLKSLELQRSLTRLAYSEARYRSLFSCVPIGVLVFDCAGILRDVNQPALKLLGWDPGEALGRAVADLGLSLESEEGRALKEDEHPVSRCLSTRQTVPALLVSFSAAQGGEGWALLEAAPIFEPKSGRLINAVMTLVDQTLRIKMEAEKEQLANQLRQASKMETIGTLAGGVAHGFNNVLQGILGQCEAGLMGVGPDERSAQHLLKIKQAAIRASSVVKQILTFSRKVPSTKTELDLRSTLKEALDWFQSSLPPDVELSAKFSDCGLTLGDADQLSQIVMNLCSNAQQAGSTRIDVSLAACGPQVDEAFPPPLRPGRYALFSVQDDGSGIPPDALERVLEPFFTTKNSGMRTGLGLSVVHGIVQEHGGGLAITSEVGVGTEMRVYLPVKPLSGSGRKEAARDRSGPRGHHHILYVDDEPDILEGTRIVLENWGYRITCRSSAREALDLLRREDTAYDVLLTDQMMPVMTGIDLAVEVRRSNPGLPVLLLSGYDLTGALERAAEIGLFRCLTKPVSLRDLHEAIQAVVRESQGRKV